jgi:predicted metal-dependent HD superfamily phosphohydrolase
MHQNLINTHVTSRFADLITSLTGDNASEKWTTSLLARYSEVQRKYHTINHIYSMLRCLDTSESLVKDPTAVKLFIFFHDWVYDPMRHDNELQSIVVFQVFANELNLPEDLHGKVSRYIKATISHSLDSEDDSDMKLCLDFDLEVLGREPSEYEVYASQIREEYSQYGDKEYTLGRIGVLQKFLARKRLFFSDKYHGRLEERARRNLEREILKLRSNETI